MKKLKNLKKFRIKNKKDIERLEKTIQEELGIDIAKYKDEEAIENFVDLLVFPKYVLNWAIRPVLITIVLFIAGFFVIDLSGFEYLSYTVIGLTLFLLSGILAGLLFLIWKMKSDIWSVIEYSLDIMKSAVGDISHVKNQLTAQNSRDILALLFTGVIHVVTIPTLSEVIREKIPIVGGLINLLIRRILTVITDKVKFDEDLISEDLSEDLSEPEHISKALDSYQKAISRATKGLDKILDISFGIAQFPLMIILGLSLVILIFSIYSLW